VETVQVLVIAASVAFLTTLLTTPTIASVMRRLGIVGIDVHKRERPVLPEMCGLAMVFALLVTAAALWAAHLIDGRVALAFSLTVAGAAAVGAWDDLRPMSPRVKPLLTALCALPIVALGVYDPHPSLPFIGKARLTIVYPLLLVPLAIAVPANAVNMMNVLNGAITTTGVIVAATLLAGALLFGLAESAALPAALMACLLAFHFYNKYPAKVFSGDSGDLAVGAAIGAIAVLSRIEVLAVIVLFPHIMNAFYLLSTVGGLRERREMARPTRLAPDGRLHAVASEGSPVTLTRIILAEGPLEERKIVRTMMALTGLCALLALLTQFTIPR